MPSLSPRTSTSQQTLAALRPRRKTRPGSGTVAGGGGGGSADAAVVEPVSGGVGDIVPNAPCSIAASLTTETAAGISAKGDLYLWGEWRRAVSCACYVSVPALRAAQQCVVQ